ncbi:MAG: PadR family transcriptional regulator [Candidatus Hodarchaeota archaeon]
MLAKKDQTFTLSHSEFIILGLIGEEPTHGYGIISNKIQERGMQNWTRIGDIGKSSIYRILKELEKRGLAQARKTKSEKGRESKEYSITDFGVKVLKHKIISVLSEFLGKNDEDFYVAYSNMYILKKDEIKTALSSSIEKLKVHIKELEEMLKIYEDRKLDMETLEIRGLFVHPIMVMEKDIEFLEWVLDELNKVEGTINGTKQ